MVLHVQPFCGFFTKIYDSVCDEGAPVVYADFYGFACSKGLNEHFAREGKGGMRCVQVPGAVSYPHLDVYKRQELHALPVKV